MSSPSSRTAPPIWATAPTISSSPLYTALLYTVRLLLDLSGIQKRFGGVTALRDANLSVEAGEVHLLLGENGAGKSTLMKIVAGIEQPAGGLLRLEGTGSSAGGPATSPRAPPPKRPPSASPWCIRNLCWPRTSPSPKISSSDAKSAALSDG